MPNNRPPEIRVRFVVYKVTSAQPRIEQKRLKSFADLDAASEYGREYVAKHGGPVTIERRVYVDHRLKSVQPDVADF